MNELKRNSEGYYDPTAYKAMTNVQKMEKRSEYLRGEIYEYFLNGGYEPKYAVVISNNDRPDEGYLNVIILTDEQKGNISEEIICVKMMYADCGMVSFAKINKFGKYMRTATADEMRRIDEGIIVSLGLKVQSVDDSKKIEKLREQICCSDEKVRCFAAENNDLKKMIDKLKFENETLELTINDFSKPEKPDCSDSLIRAETERDLYKAQYERLLDLLLAR